MNRRSILIAAAFLLAAGPALAAEDDPAAVVREVYRVHAAGWKANVPAWKSAQRRRLFSRALLAAFERDGKRREPNLSYDPVYNAQDAKIDGLAVALLRRTGKTAVVEARFRNFDQAVRLEYDLVLEPGGWRVSDIRSNGTKPDGMLSRALSGR